MKMISSTERKPAGCLNRWRASVIDPSTTKKSRIISSMVAGIFDGLSGKRNPVIGTADCKVALPNPNLGIKPVICKKDDPSAAGKGPKI